MSIIRGFPKVIKVKDQKMHQEVFYNALKQSPKCLSEIYYAKSILIENRL